MASKLKKFLIAPVCIAAGLINSLIGAGGGIVLSLALPALTKGAFPDRRDTYINSQAAMIPSCAISCIIYSLRGQLDTVGFSLIAIPAAAGGAVGCILLSKIKSRTLHALFSCLVVWSGIRMIWG